jgi:hypothetical protein
MSCVGTVQTTPPTLEIKSLIKSVGGGCTVGAPRRDRPRRWQWLLKFGRHEDSHDVEIINYGVRPYEVDIRGECQTPYIRYRETDGLSPVWEQSLFVQASPGSRGPTELVASQPLTSLCAARAQIILTRLRWAVSKSPCTSGEEFFSLQANTL